MSKRLEHGEEDRSVTRLHSNDLVPIVYHELRRIAAHKLSREPRDVTLQATALVHEAFLRLVGSDRVGWKNRAHFFGAASEAMRRVLIDHARTRQRDKRQPGIPRAEVPIDSLPAAVTRQSEQLLLLDVALSRLEQVDLLKAELVKLRFFGGLSLHDAARLLSISPRTAERYWSFARVWLYQEMMMELQVAMVEFENLANTN